MTNSPAPAPAPRRLGRPVVLYTCGHCLGGIMATQIKHHQTTCPSNPAVIRAAKQSELEAELEGYMAPIEQQAAERLAAVAAKAVR